MKLTRQEEIAILFTSELAKRPDTFISLSEISQKHAVSQLFLKKIARMLKKQGLIKSREGLNGGYELGRPADAMSAWDVMEAVSGKSVIEMPNGTMKCPLSPSCTPQTIRHLISEAFKRYLSDVTIDQFISKKERIV